MPRVKPLTDSRETQLKADIGAIIGGLNITRQELSHRSGIASTTLTNHLKSIRKMTVGDLFDIQDAAKKGGLKVENLRMRIDFSGD